MKPTLLILAAGIGSRYGGLKQIDPVGPSGQTILDYSVYDAKRAGFGKIVFIIRKEIEEDFKSVFADRLSKSIPIEWVFQELNNLPVGIQPPKERTKPWGTGHAVLMASEVIKEPFAVINADDFYGREAFEKATDFFNTDLKESDYAMVAYQLKNTLSEYGTVSRGICKANKEGWLESVIENTKIAREGSIVINTWPDGLKSELHEDTLVSMNFWCFKPAFFGQLDSHFRKFIMNNLNDPKAEFYIPTAVDNLIKNDQARVKVLANTGQWFGITYKEDKPQVIEKINQLTSEGEYPAEF
ncbi:MAG: nucleotidyltransferase family protein [Chloroflexota bacterium]|nr:sugar phosphate nucleotidyltransferase [Lentimicrobium sp.]